ncbi:GIY-YIG nuclease family protein [Bacillus sp. JJ1533]|uniref:GIY-YIG nuclease family protein n=1 Tax=Bacillus sp. JJ1533 TaxID=3122959 RepID=UPI002FFEF125
MLSYKDKWWYSTPMILTLSLFSFLVIPAVVAILLLIFQLVKRKEFYKQLKEHSLLNIQLDEKKINLENLNIEIEKKTKELEDKQEFEKLLRREFEEATSKEKEMIFKKAKEEAMKIEKEAENNLKEVVDKTIKYNDDLESLSTEYESLIKEVNRYKNQARKFKSQIVGLKNFDTRFPHTINFEDVENQIEQLQNELAEDTLLGTVLRLHLHSDNSKELRKLSNATNKEIKNVLSGYEDRYTTKANKTIYNLMIIGLQAEIQILLYQLKYNKLDESIQSVKNIITKYLAICGDGNRSILPTITKFLTEIEPLYIELINIEYKYHVYREQEKEEQRMIKEQMKQEARERKLLEEEKKKLENEERKFKIEMERNKELLSKETDSEKIEQLKERLKELEAQMMNIEDKKEEIASLTLGKAGYVYIISNLGSFGDKMFKVGMTRRMVPQDRIDELGDASVPFRFDVHAMIFSDDAVSLEQMLHKELNDDRVNKVNYRKEFFRVDVETLRKLVEEIDPTAEFVTTMLAEEYRQTIAIEESFAV